MTVCYFKIYFVSALYSEVRYSQTKTKQQNYYSLWLEKCPDQTLTNFGHVLIKKVWYHMLLAWESMEFLTWLGLGRFLKVLHNENFDIRYFFFIKHPFSLSFRRHDSNSQRKWHHWTTDYFECLHEYLSHANLVKNSLADDHAVVGGC
jgi:hypothetical protein